MLVQDNSLLVFIALALFIGICIGILFGAWFVSRPHRLVPAALPDSDRPHLRVVDGRAEWR